MIKKLSQLLALMFIVLSVSAQSDEEVLMTVGDMDVTVGEFKYIYEKNNGKKADYSPRSVSEYLELYKKFKLKVAKAKDMRLDTIQTLKEELNGYKRQLANSYLMDKEIMDNLVDQLFERKKQDAGVSHIFFAFPPKKKGKGINIETKDAEERATKAYQELKSGKSWSTVLSQYSDDKASVANDGKIGYYTAMMPNGYYDFENAMYTLKPGEYSEPIMTPNGYHIIKSNGLRPARGRVQVAQILVKKKGNPAAEGKIKEAAKELAAGGDWKQAVIQYSDDSKTKTTQGVLPTFGINVYDSKFEDIAFGLKSKDDVSEPFESRIGWHILKLVSKVPADSKELFAKIYEPKIKKDDRYEQARKSMIVNIKKAADFKLDEVLYNTWVNGLPAEFLNYKWKIDKKDMAMGKTLFSFGGDKTFSLEQFAKFCKKNTKSRLRYNQSDNPTKQVADKLLGEYVEEKAIEFEQENLEKKYADFRSLMREYEEGILLFEATKMAVWDKANQDTVGLQKFYEGHSSRYKTEPKAVLATVTFIKGEKKTLNKAIKMAKKKDLTQVAKKYNKKETILKITEETLAQSDQKFAGLTWEEGSVSDLRVDTYTKNPYFRKIKQIIPSRAKSLKEARGYVVSDYQENLEKNWIKELKNQFEIKLNNDVLKKLTK